MQQFINKRSVMGETLPSPAASAAASVNQEGPLYGKTWACLVSGKNAHKIHVTVFAVRLLNTQLQTIKHKTLPTLPNPESHRSPVF